MIRNFVRNVSQNSGIYVIFSLTSFCVLCCNCVQPRRKCHIPSHTPIQVLDSGAPREQVVTHTHDICTSGREEKEEKSSSRFYGQFVIEYFVTRWY